jgi:hypothetical protein
MRYCPTGTKCIPGIACDDSCEELCNQKQVKINSKKETNICQKENKTQQLQS